jgi:hypothetical protein
MSSGRNWQTALNRQRRNRALADSKALTGHCQAIAATLTGQARPPTKAELRAQAAAAVAAFQGRIQRLPARRRS